MNKLPGVLFESCANRVARDVMCGLRKIADCVS